MTFTIMIAYIQQLITMQRCFAVLFISLLVVVAKFCLPEKHIHISNEFCPSVV